MYIDLYKNIFVSSQRAYQTFNLFFCIRVNKVVWNVNAGFCCCSPETPPPPPSLSLSLFLSQEVGKGAACDRVYLNIYFEVHSTLLETDKDRFTRKRTEADAHC